MKKKDKKRKWSNRDNIFVITAIIILIISTALIIIR